MSNDPTAASDEQQVTLPPLMEDCRHCTGPAGDARRAAHRDAWNKWDERQASAHGAWAEEHDPRVSDWLDSTEYQELTQTMPEDLPERGCVECDWTGTLPTAAGEQVFDLLTGLISRINELEREVGRLRGV
jgi:hypothetical protein